VTFLAAARGQRRGQHARTDDCVAPHVPGGAYRHMRAWKYSRSTLSPLASCEGATPCPRPVLVSVKVWCPSCDSRTGQVPKDSLIRHGPT